MAQLMKPADSAAAIKLFGKTIALRAVSADAMVTLHTHPSSASSPNSPHTKGTSADDEELTEATTLSGASDDPNRTSPTSQNTCKNGPEPNIETSASQDKTPPKNPEKVLPCPRCKSVDTKFCYYNNYNVNQPRHFCKNCQRYWTCGGAMRNVPVGSGRRKNKIVAIRNYRHLTIPDGIHLSSMRQNGFVVFGPDMATCKPLGPLGFPIPFYPTTSFWGPPGPTNASTLGKHPREEVVFGQSYLGQGSLSDKGGSMPVSDNLDCGNGLGRTSTRPIKNERVEFGYNTSLFEGSGPRGRGGSSTTMLEANPAALSRSLGFRESV